MSHKKSSSDSRSMLLHFLLLLPFNNWLPSHLHSLYMAEQTHAYHDNCKAGVHRIRIYEAPSQKLHLIFHSTSIWLIQSFYKLKIIYLNCFQLLLLCFFLCVFLFIFTFLSFRWKWNYILSFHAEHDLLILSCRFYHHRHRCFLCCSSIDTTISIGNKAGKGKQKPKPQNMHFECILLNKFAFICVLWTTIKANVCQWIEDWVCLWDNSTCIVDGPLSHEHNTTAKFLRYFPFDLAQKEGNG